MIKQKISLSERLMFLTFAFLTLFLILIGGVAFLEIKFRFSQEYVQHKFEHENQTIAQNTDVEIANLIQSALFLSETIRQELSNKHQNKTQDTLNLIRAFEKSHNVNISVFLEHKNILIQDHSVSLASHFKIPWVEKQKRLDRLYAFQIQKDPIKQKISLLLNFLVIDNQGKIMAVFQIDKPIHLPKSLKFHHYLTDAQGHILLNFSDPFGPSLVLSELPEWKQNRLFFHSTNLKTFALKSINWDLVSIQTRHPIPIEIQKELILLFFFGLGILFLIGIPASTFISNTVLYPVKKLREKSENILRDPSKKIELLPNTSDEIGMLSLSLDKLRQELYLYKNQLEGLIQSRTRKLKFSIETLKEKEEMVEQEIELAASIQKGILPKPYHTESLEITPYVRQMGSVGGDIIDILQGENFYCTYLADAAGHGVPASLITMLTKISFEYALHHGNNLENLLIEVNDRIYNLMNNSKIKYINYFTLFIVFLRSDFSFSYLSAGHLPAIHFHRATGECSLLSTPTSMIGIFDSSIVHFKPKEGFLEEGDKLLVFSDGYVEVENPKEEFYETKSLIQALLTHHELTGQNLKDALIQDLEKFRHNTPLKDDLSLLIIERHKGKNDS